MQTPPPVSTSPSHRQTRKPASPIYHPIRHHLPRCVNTSSPLQMPALLSPYHQSDMSGSMPGPQLQRRHSRGSGSQSACRSSRVEKPRSHHNSPRTMERRKTTNEAKLYATLDDHFKMMFGMAPDDETVEERPQPTRPLSWHPSSTQVQTSRTSSYFEPMPQQDWPRQYSASSSEFLSGL